MTSLRRSIRVGDARVAVEVTAPSLTGPVDALYPECREPPGDGTADLVLRQGSDGGFRVEVAEGEWVCETLAEALVHVEHEITDLLLARLPGVRVLHAGGVAVAGGALLFPGPGGSGKSSLTAGLGARGLPVYGDDVVLLDAETGRVRPFPRALRVREPARAILGLPDSPPPLDRIWPDVSFLRPPALGTAWADPGTVREVVFPRRDEAAERPRLAPLEGGESVRRLLAQVLFVAEPGRREFELAAGILERAGAFELVFQGSDQAVELLFERFRG